MSGGAWGYRSEHYREVAEEVQETFELLAIFEHELDWGICGDTCSTCAKNRVAEALIQYFDGNTVAARAIARDQKQHQCYRCTRRQD